MAAAGSPYDKASAHRGAPGSPHLFLVSMETRTGMFRRTGAANRPSQGKRKTCVVLLAFHRLRSRRFHTPWNQSVVYTLQIRSRASHCTPDAACLSLFVCYTCALKTKNKICQRKQRMYLTTLGLCCQSF